MQAKVNMRVNELICKAWLKLSAEDNSYADQWISDETWLRVIRKRCPRHGPRCNPTCTAQRLLGFHFPLSVFSKY